MVSQHVTKGKNGDKGRAIVDDLEAKKTRKWLRAQYRNLKRWQGVAELVGVPRGTVQMMATGQRPVCESARVAYRKSKPGYVRRFIKKIGVPFLKAKVGISPTGRYGRGGRIIYDE